MNLKHSIINSTTPPSTRIVVGAGAMGLFLALELKKEYPEDEHFLYSRKTLPFPLTIKVKQEFFLFDTEIVTNIQLIINSIKHSCVYIYICLPPENINEFIQKIAPFINSKIHFSFIFLNNGIILQEELNLLLNSQSVSVIRAIALAGFMRTVTEKAGTIIENTSGNKIYYNSLTVINNNLKFTSKNFLVWEKIDNIYGLERAKFFINLILLIFIGCNLQKNDFLFINPGLDILQQSAHHYCQLFKDNLCTKNYAYTQLIETLYNTKDNINSVSLAWHRGNSATASYFLNTLKQLLQNSSQKDSVSFFEDLIAQKGLQHV